MKNTPVRAQGQGMALLAHGIRGAIGIVCLAATMLFVPIHFVTPVMTGVSFVMIVTGALGAWRCGQRDPRMAWAAKVVVWTLPVLSLLVFAYYFAFGQIIDLLATN